MIERLRRSLPPELVNLLDSELVELREHRRRVGFLLTALFVCLIILALDNEEAPPPAAQLVEDEPATAPVKPVERIDRRTEIIGLARASEDVELINPFAVDLPKPPPEPLIVPITAPPPPPRLSVPPSTVESKSFEPPEPPLRVMLTLKGTAISDDKKLAVVRREVVTSNNKSDDQPDDRSNSQPENRLLKIGEAIDGRKVVDIGKDYVAFEDGERLELPRFSNDD
ncbi:MAG: hypothetical protein IJU71_12385 [Selenomonadaceae bacterium]|nr:hypothetical protein [Selenomonadaceae bacterium]